MSKKVILVVTILLSFFLFQENAQAVDTMTPTWQSDDLQFHNLGTMNEVEKQEFLGTNGYKYYSRAKSYAINNCNTDSYYIYRNTSSGGYNVACFNQVDYKGASITVSSYDEYYMKQGKFSIEADVFIQGSKKAYLFNETYNGTPFNREQYHYMEFGPRTNSELENAAMGGLFAFESNIPITFVYDNLFDSYATVLGIKANKYREYERVIIDNKEFPVGTMFIGNDGSYKRKYKYVDIIDINTLTDKKELEWRYYGANPSEFFVTSYENGELPEGVGCITGTNIYECNISSIKDVIGSFGYWREGTYRSSYVESPLYSMHSYSHTFLEDLTKYGITNEDGSMETWGKNFYRVFKLDLSGYIDTPMQYKSDKIYVYYNVDNLYEKNYENGIITNLEDIDENNAPPTADTGGNIIVNTFNELVQPFVNLINKKLPIINQIGEIIGSLKYDKKELKKPSLTIDLTKTGINFKTELFSDKLLNAYDQYRYLLYMFIYISVGIIVIPKVIGYVQGYFGGDKE